MKKIVFACSAMLLGIGLTLPSVAADGILKKHHPTRPDCEPGFQIVEEIVMQDVTRTVCKMVPDLKKKWVYSWIDDPFCFKDSKHGQCPECSGPHCRKQLVKIQIDEPCATMKCVAETITERVPVTVYRKVPLEAPKTKIEQIPIAPKPVGK